MLYAILIEYIYDNNKSVSVKNGTEMGKIGIATYKWLGTFVEKGDCP